MEHSNSLQRRTSFWGPFQRVFEMRGRPRRHIIATEGILGIFRYLFECLLKAQTCFDACCYLCMFVSIRDFFSIPLFQTPSFHPSLRDNLFPAVHYFNLLFLLRKRKTCYFTCTQIYNLSFFSQALEKAPHLRFMTDGFPLPPLNLMV